MGEPTQRIDHIFPSDAMADQLATCDMRTGADAVAASDHYAIWAEFRGERERDRRDAAT